jgi:hypothetical protein
VVLVKRHKAGLFVAGLKQRPVQFGD